MKYTQRTTIGRGNAGSLMRWLEEYINILHPNNAVYWWKEARHPSVSREKCSGFTSEEMLPEQVRYASAYIYTGANEGHRLEVIVAPGGDGLHSVRPLCVAKLFGSEDDAWQIARAVSKALEEIFYYERASQIPEMFRRLPRNKQFDSCREIALRGTVVVQIEHHQGETHKVRVIDSEGVQLDSVIVDSIHAAEALAEDWMTIFNAQHEIDVPITPVLRKAGEEEDVDDDEDDGPHKFLNHYRCPNCEHEWEDVWTAQCDDDCPECGTRHISPYKSEDV